MEKYIIVITIEPCHSDEANSINSCPLVTEQQVFSRPFMVSARG